MFLFLLFPRLFSGVFGLEGETRGGSSSSAVGNERDSTRTHREREREEESENLTLLLRSLPRTYLLSFPPPEELFPPSPPRFHCPVKTPTMDERTNGGEEDLLIEFAAVGGKLVKRPFSPFRRASVCASTGGGQTNEKRDKLPARLDFPCARLSSRALCYSKAEGGGQSLRTAPNFAPPKKSFHRGNLEFSVPPNTLL